MFFKSTEPVKWMLHIHGERLQMSKRCETEPAI